MQNGHQSPNLIDMHCIYACPNSSFQTHCLPHLLFKVKSSIHFWKHSVTALDLKGGKKLKERRKISAGSKKIAVKNWVGVGRLVPILHIAEFVLYCRLVPNLCTVLNSASCRTVHQPANLINMQITTRLG